MSPFEIGELAGGPGGGGEEPEAVDDTESKEEWRFDRRQIAAGPPLVLDLPEGLGELGLRVRQGISIENRARVGGSELAQSGVPLSCQPRVTPVSSA